MILLEKYSPVTPENIFQDFSDEERRNFANDALNLLQLCGVDIGRGSYDIDKDHEASFRELLHTKVFTQSRLGYAVMQCFPGIMEYSMQYAFAKLMTSTRPDTYSMRYHVYEDQVLWYMLKQLKVTEVLRLFVDLTGKGDKTKAVNKRRARNLCFWYFLNPTTKTKTGEVLNIELWAVKYRAKLRYIFTHFWGESLTNGIRYIFSKQRWTQRDTQTLQKNIDVYVFDPRTIAKIYECVAFILSSGSAKKYYGKGYTLPLLKQHINVDSDLDLGNELPYEVYQGKYSTFHTEAVTREEFLEKAKSTMTEKEKFTYQQSARKSGVTIRAKAQARSLKELWVYALSNEMTQSMEVAMRQKAEAIAKTLPIDYTKIGIVIDDSDSASGTKEQKHHPMASMLAMRDILVCACQENAVIRSASGRDYRMPDFHTPYGDTELATPFVQVLQQQPDAIFVLTDGHDNVPAGRFQEVFEIVRDIGCHIPVYQCNPTTTAVLTTSMLSESIPILPIAIPEKVGVNLFTALLSIDPAKGLERYIQKAFTNFQQKMAALQATIKGGHLT